VVTEEVVPLATYIASRDGSSEFSVAWGLHQILVSECKGQMVCLEIH